MSVEYRIISIGTLAAHPLWNESLDARTGHATTTLIQAGEQHILVDPSLPGMALLARITERSQIRPEQITDVFLTNFTADRRRSLATFEHARWLIHEPEKSCSMSELQILREEASATQDDEILQLREQEIALLERCHVAPDSIAPGVSLFPLPGFTPGTCGLLLSQPTSTVLICGDAIPTSEHLAQGKVLPNCVDIQQAQESFREAIEIADILILGRDNLVLNPIRNL